jgi:hypothetical protein
VYLGYEIGFTEIYADGDTFWHFLDLSLRGMRIMTIHPTFCLLGFIGVWSEIGLDLEQNFSQNEISVDERGNIPTWLIQASIPPIGTIRTKANTDSLYLW